MRASAISRRLNIAALRALGGYAAWPDIAAQARLLAADPAWRPVLPDDHPNGAAHDA